MFQGNFTQLHECPRKLWPSQGLAVVVALNIGNVTQIAGELSKQVLEMTFESDGSGNG